MSELPTSVDGSDHDFCFMITFRGHTKFRLKASWTRGEQELFVRQLGGQPHEQPFFLLYSHCLPLLQSLAPTTTVRGLRLEDFVRSTTYHLEITPSPASDEQPRITGMDSCMEETSYHLLPTLTAGFSSLGKTVPRTPASEVMLAPCRDDLDDLGSLGGKVMMTSGEVFHFKPREDGREKEFDRELEILCRLKDLAIGKNELRVSQLRGIVVSGDCNEKTIGMLIVLIAPHALGLHPLEKGFCGRTELHQKWEAQVSTTVRELHAHGIVWGDVNPCNIIIDPDLDAWVIDFGGNYNWEFVDKDNAETEEGDWQGLRRLFRDWLARRRIWPSGEIGIGMSSDVELL